MMMETRKKTKLSQQLFYQIFSQTNGHAVITGNLINFGFSTGKIKENSFEARSVLTENSLCGGFTPAVITFSGECGAGSTVDFATDSGMTGTVTGNIACA